MTSINDLNECGQSVWYDNVERQLLDSGEMKRIIDLGVTGVTSNPTIFERAITTSSAYDADILDSVKQGKSVLEIYDSLTLNDISRVADLLLPVYEKTEHNDGYVSVEVSPTLSEDSEATVSEGRRLFEAIDRPNVMIKVPATDEGIVAAEELIKHGINVNVTLIFSVEMYDKVTKAYLSGLESRLRAGLSLTVASVASFFISRVDTLVDKLIQDKGLDSSLQGCAGVANAKMVYRLFEDRFSSSRFRILESKGARVQRPLWASTGVKNPKYSDLLYVSSLVGSNTVNTMPPNTLDAVIQYRDKIEPTINVDVEECWNILKALEDHGIILKTVTDQLLIEGLNSFDKSFEALLKNLEIKAQSLRI